MSNGEGESGTSAEAKYVIGAYALVAIGVVAAIVLAEKNEVTIGVSEGFAPFAVIYIVAQAIERLIQPITGFTVKAEEKSKATTKLATAKGKHAVALIAGDPGLAQAEAGKTIEERKKLKVIQADRAVAFWGLATLLALLACGALELGMIQSVAKVTGKSGGVPDWFNDLDVIITGIAIGAGTKPLHDLISTIQSSKQKADPVVGGASA
jgi:hypothetical protein